MDTTIYVNGSTAQTPISNPNPIPESKPSPWKKHLHDLKMLFVILVVIVGFVIIHEGTHYAVYNNFDCKNVSVGFDGYSPATFGTCSGSEERLLEIDKIQSQVELFQYPLLFFVVLLALLTINSPVQIIIKR